MDFSELKVKIPPLPSVNKTIGQQKTFPNQNSRKNPAIINKAIKKYSSEKFANPKIFWNFFQ